ncbi:MAG: hemolysin III family protein [Kiritimatiellia bacterium]
MHKTQSPLNEWINALTHGLAAVLAVPVTVLLIIRAVRFGDAYGVVAVSIFGTTLFLLYTVSTLYHALPPSRVKHRFRTFDHIAIYLLIAGSYTPFTLKLLVAGGLAYTGGVFFYANHRLPFHHGIWHLFVITGSLLHALAVYTLFPANTF